MAKVVFTQQVVVLDDAVVTSLQALKLARYLAQ
jgi:hypothetical protein